VAVTWEIWGSALILTFIGDSADEPAEAITAAVSDPRFTAGTSMVADVRLSADEALPEVFRRWACWLAALRTKGLSSQVAVVVAEKYQYGLARMATVHLDREGMDLTIFTDLDEAIHWVDTAHQAGGNKAALQE
jgi:hypothetical protein